VNYKLPKLLQKTDKHFHASSALTESTPILADNKKNLIVENVRMSTVVFESKKPINGDETSHPVSKKKIKQEDTPNQLA
jgi:hypothetical protein